MRNQLRAGRYPNGSASLPSNLTFDALGRSLVIRRPTQESRAGSLRATATAITLSLALAACQSAPIKDRVVEVVKPVAVQPITPEQVPALPSPLPPRPSSLSAAADVLLGKWCEAVAYFLKADPLLKVSAGLPPTEPRGFPECEGQ